MVIMDFIALILAAGQGTRMRSTLPKVLHKIAGKTMLSWVSDVARKAGATKLYIISAPDGTQFSEYTDNTDTEIIIQHDPQGTGHAVSCCLPALTQLPPNQPVIILYADTPLVKPDTIKVLADLDKTKNDLCVLGFRTDDPNGYGRLITDANGQLETIIEDRDADKDQKAITLVNSGLMAARAGLLTELLPSLSADNTQNEYYLTDLIKLAKTHHYSISYMTAPQNQVMGVNDRTQQACAEAVIQQRLRADALTKGVTMIAPDTVFLSADTLFGRDIVIEPHVVIGPQTEIADHCIIKSFSHIEGTKINTGCMIGPYARLRAGTNLAENVKIGNFVETKNATLDEGVKANHLSYIGDANIGADTNIGAGVITCNYDGINKAQTVVGKNGFIGSNTSLIAPIQLGDNVLVGAGSALSRDVSDNALALTRDKQREIRNGAIKFRKASIGKKQT